MSSNNSFNLPLEDGEIIVGRSGLTPVAATLTAAPGGNVVVTNGAGTIALAVPIAPSIKMNKVPPSEDIMGMTANNGYVVRDPVNIAQFLFPSTATFGDLFFASSSWGESGTASQGFTLSCVGGQNVYSDTQPQGGVTVNGTIPGQPCCVYLMCVDDTVPNAEQFQVISKVGTIIIS